MGGQAAFDDVQRFVLVALDEDVFPLLHGDLMIERLGQGGEHDDRQRQSDVRHAGLQGRIVEHLLHVERDEVDAAEEQQPTRQVHSDVASDDRIAEQPGDRIEVVRQRHDDYPSRRALKVFD